MPSISNLSVSEIKLWLAAALAGEQAIPQLAHDESPHISILRYRDSLPGYLRRDLRLACIALAEDFCDGRISPATPILQELLYLVSELEAPEITQKLALLPCDPARWLQLSDESQISIISFLAEASPPQSIDFWNHVISLSPKSFGPSSVTALTKIDLRQAVAALPLLPDDTAIAEAISLKFELIFDSLSDVEAQQTLTRLISAVIHRCTSAVSLALSVWIDSKEKMRRDSPTAPSLVRALNELLGPVESRARHYTPKLCEAAAHQ